MGKGSKGKGGGKGGKKRAAKGGGKEGGKGKVAVSLPPELVSDIALVKHAVASNFPHLSIRAKANETLRIQFASTDTVAELNRKISDSTGCPLHQVLSDSSARSFSFLAKEHFDALRGVEPSACDLCEYRLADLGIKAGDTVHLTEFSSLSLSRHCCIPETERRAITVSQLQQLLSFVAERCDRDGLIVGWSSSWNGAPLHYHSLNLYDACYWVIHPATEDPTSTAEHSRGWSYVELVAPEGTKAQDPDYFCSHWWGEAVVSSSVHFMNTTLFLILAYVARWTLWLLSHTTRSFITMSLHTSSRCSASTAREACPSNARPCPMCLGA